MSVTSLNASLVATALAALLITWAEPASAGDRAQYLASCEKAGAEKAKCACVADKIDAAFKDTALTFAYEALSKSVGELANVQSGLSEKDEDAVVDTSIEFMKACGLAN
ncbi:MAG: hypothetical protein KDJ37_08545 [Hyphomicrobiaceae bacterium]|nr:hypothetical protein [Hyphomicrobiaceae bacterium]